MNFTEEIKQYIFQLKTNSGNPAGVQEKTRTENILKFFCERYMHETLKTWPEETDYKAFRAEIDKPDTPKFATENINRVKRFFVWLNSERNNDTMTENDVINLEETPQHDLFSGTEAETWPEDGSTAPVQNVKNTVKSKAGRKRLDNENGEIRSEKFTVYLTPTQALALKALCMLDNISSVADLINSLITANIKNNKEDIDGFFALRAKREKTQ